MKDNGGKWKPEHKEAIMIGGTEKKIGLWVKNERKRISSRTNEQITRLEKIGFQYNNRRHIAFDML